MFKALEIGSTIDLDPNTLIAVVRSTNTRELALGSGPKRPTRAFTMGFYDEARGLYRVYVFLARQDRGADSSVGGLLFRCDPPDGDLETYRALQREAGTMVRSQGFEMEVIELDALDHSARADLLHELPFSDAARVPPPPVVGAASRARDPVVGSTVDAAAVPPVSTEISLPQAQAVTVLGRLLSLF